MAIQKNSPTVVYIAQKARLFLTISRKKDNKNRAKATTLARNILNSQRAVVGYEKNQNILLDTGFGIDID